MWQICEAPATKSSKSNEDLVALPSGFLEISNTNIAGTRKRKHPVEISMDEVVNLSSLSLHELYDYAENCEESEAAATHFFASKHQTMNLALLIKPGESMYHLFPYPYIQLSLSRGI